jgi:tripartite-type tricarboxylate transporter receptor subunit TctC
MTTIRRTTFCALFVPLSLFLGVPAQAQQDYPSRPIRLIVPTAPGGTNDILARSFGARLSDVFKQQVLVDNRASASGVIAGELTANAPPDGYTLLLTYHQHTINAALMPKLPYHAVNSFTPITQLTGAAQMLVVNSASPPRNLGEFVAWTKTISVPLNFGSAGIGSGGHLAGELYKQMTGVKAEHIPYKGTGPSLTALLAGEYQFSFAGLLGVAPLVRSGRLRSLAVTAAARVAALPDVPAVAEALPGFEVIGWYGVIGPANLPRPIVARLHAELIKILNQPEVRERIVADGSEPAGSSPEEFRQFMLADLAKWAKVVKESGIKVE